MFSLESDLSIGSLGVTTTDYKGHSIEEVAEMATNKIVSISDNADPMVKAQAYAFRDKTALDIVELGPEFWKEYGLADEKGIKEKWKQIYDMGGIDLLDRIGIAGGVSKMAGGGIVGIRKPNAIAPTGGPMSQGLRSLYNNVKKS